MIRHLTFLCLTVLILITNAPADEHKVKFEGRTLVEVPDEFDKVREELKAALTSPITCPNCSPQSIKVNCTYKDFCDLLSVNKEKAALYQNKKGEFIPNYHLFEIEKKLKECWQKKLWKKSNGLNPEFVQLAQSSQQQSKKLKDKQIALLEANRAFLSLVRKNHEEATLTALYEASLVKAIEDAKKGKEVDLNYTTSKTESEIEADLTQLEKISGKKFSKQLRDQYIKLQVLQWKAISTVSSSEVSSMKSDNANKDKWQPINQNPFLNLDLFTHRDLARSVEAIKANQQLYQQQVDRSYEIFVEAQKDILNLLKQKRTKQNKDEIDNMMHRVSTIRFKPMALQARMKDKTLEIFRQCQQTNAYYQPAAHTFYVCPQIMQTPRETLKSTFTHEITHSIDPCNLSRPLISTDRQTAQGKKSQEQQDYFDYEPKLPEQGDPKIDYQVDLIGEPQFSNYKIKTEEPGIPMSKHPFFEVIKCLTGKDSVEARMKDQAALEKSLDMGIDKLKRIGATAETNPLLAQLIKTKNNLPTLIRDYGACAFIPGSGGTSQIEEAFADQIDLKVVSQDAAKLNTTEKKTLVFESILPLMTNCGKLWSSMDEKVQKILKDEQCESNKQNTLQNDMESIAIAEGLNEETHPWDTDRIDRLFMASPEFNAALGCTAKVGVKYCE